jgi:hypothetical protein
VSDGRVSPAFEHVGQDPAGGFETVLFLNPDQLVLGDISEKAGDGLAHAAIEFI